MRKVYCNYFYDLVSHALILIRPECMFNTVKSIRASTSYCWPDYIIRNLFVCHQVAQHVGESNTAAAKQKSQLSKPAKSLLHSKNIVTPISVIKRNARCWQDHLKKQLILFFLEKVFGGSREMTSLSYTIPQVPQVRDLSMAKQQVFWLVAEMKQVMLKLKTYLNPSIQ